MSEQYFQKILDLMSKAGPIALDLMDQCQSDLKPDQSVVTQADKDISQMMKAELSEYLQTDEHLLIDEEDPEMDKYLNQSLLDQTPYIWSIDPIDGTRLYANRIPTFGISIGLIKELKPWMGAVYFPALGELFCCDGQQAYFCEQAFTSEEKKTPIHPIDQEITSRSIFLCDDSVVADFTWDDRLCQVLISSCAVVDLCWPTIGRGCGGYFKSHLWDFAGSWPIAEFAGLRFRSFESGKVLDQLSVSDFYIDKTPWKTKEGYILSSERNYSILKDNLKRL